MVEELRRLLLLKNKAYLEYERARRVVDRRIHSNQNGNAGPVPEEWWARLGHLEEQYRDAKLAVLDELGRIGQGRGETVAREHLRWTLPGVTRGRG